MFWGDFLTLTRQRSHISGRLGIRCATGLGDAHRDVYHEWLRAREHGEQHALAFREPLAHEAPGRELSVRESKIRHELAGAGLGPVGDVLV
ncbi:hypothetical protein BDB13_6267 [Rhodococcus sp. OK302]|nr:hypothetical protein BDB13_6267 [Rhodococcus sp. OK302]